MASSLNKNVLLIPFAVLLAINCVSSETTAKPPAELESIFPFKKVTVDIFNALDEPHGGQDLTLHCKSKNEDLGFHTLVYQQLYSFRFQPNPIAYRTLFFCSFSWPDDQSLHYVDIYYENRDECTLCSYKIYRFGACRYDEKTGQIGGCLSWNKVVPPPKQLGV